MPSGAHTHDAGDLNEGTLSIERLSTTAPLTTPCYLDGSTKEWTAMPSATAEPTPTDPTPTPTPVVGRTDYWPEDFGYDPAKSASEKGLAMQAFANALTDGKTGVLRKGKVYDVDRTLFFPPGCEGGRLVNRGVLRSTVPTASSRRIQAPGFTIEGRGKFVAANVTSRGSSLAHHALVVEAEGVELSGFTIDGSHAAGMFLYGAVNPLVRDVKVMNTQADGFHNTFGSRGGRFRSVETDNVGDDCFAVVSYTSDPAVCSDIVWESPKARNGKARGCAVVGGSNIRYNNIDLDGTAAAAIYIAIESSWPCYAIDNVRVTGGRIQRANTGSSDHGAVFFWTAISGKTLSDSSVDRLTIDDTRSGVSGNIRFVTNNNGAALRIGVSDILLRGTTLPPDVQGNILTSQYEAKNVSRQLGWGV